MDNRQATTNGNVLLLANVLLAGAVAGGVGHGSGLWWTVYNFEPDLRLRAISLLPLWADGVIQLGVALMAYGFIRSLGGGAKAAWFVWTGLGAAVLGMLVGGSHPFYGGGAEWALLSATVFDIALVGLVFFAAYLRSRSCRSEEARHTP